MEFIQLKRSLKNSIDGAYLLYGDDNYVLGKAYSLIYNALDITMPELNEYKFNDDSIDFDEVSKALLTMPMMSVGATGVISVVANAFPEEMSQMVNYCLRSDFNNALPLHYKLLPIINALFEEGNPAGVKAALEIKGMISNNLRLPLTKVSKTLYNKLSTLIANL